MLCNALVLLKQQKGPLQENPATTAALKHAKWRTVWLYCISSSSPESAACMHRYTHTNAHRDRCTNTFAPCRTPLVCLNSVGLKPLDYTLLSSPSLAHTVIKKNMKHHSLLLMFWTSFNFRSMLLKRSRIQMHSKYLIEERKRWL